MRASTYLPPGNHCSGIKNHRKQDAQKETCAVFYMLPGLVISCVSCVHKMDMHWHIILLHVRIFNNMRIIFPYADSVDR